MTSTTDRSKLLFACCAIVFATYTTKFARDLIIPSLPALAHSFNVPEQALQLNVALYFLGITVSRLFWPTLSDIINRRKILLTCLSLFFISTLASLLVNNIYGFLASRFFQAFSIAGIPLITRALIFKQSGKLKTIQLFASMSLLAAWAPAVATAVGGFIQQHFYWQMQFYLLLCLVIVGFILYAFLPAQAEQHENNGARTQHLVQGYLSILRNRAFWRISLPFSLLTAMLAVYYTITPFLFIDGFKLSPQTYGLLTFSIIAGLTFGMFISGQLTKKFSIHTIILIGIVLSASASIVLLVIALLMMISVSWIMTCLTIFTVGIGLLNPTVKAQVMDMHQAHSGSVLACLGATEALVSTLAAAIATFIDPTNVIWLAVVLCGLSLLALVTR